MTTAALLAKLNARRVAIRADAGQLIIDAPKGVITERLRTELIKHKAQLVAALEGYDNPNVGVSRAAWQELATLLAAGYRRYTAVPRFGPIGLNPPGEDKVANSLQQSVHGVVP